jgi:23S rRNA (cytosine1962-C5)-methyltransferase
MSLPAVVLGRIGLGRFQAGHPWIYRGHLQPREATPDAPGPVRILDQRKKTIGVGLYSPASQISLRVLSREERAIDRAFFVERLTNARAYRDRHVGELPARREVFSESDGLPSLIVDRYGSHLVMQVLSAGLEALEPALLDALEEVYRPASILARNDVSVRSLEGLARTTEQKRGTTPPQLEVPQGALTFLVDPWKGQKTGLFLDQVENHTVAAGLSRGRVLDAFSYNGGFGLAMARRAGQVVMVDSSAEAIERTRANAERNDIGNIKYHEENVFAFLKAADVAGEKFDVIVLDPPAFARNKTELEGSVRGYKEINLRAMKLLYPGGTIVTCSCSHHMTEELFTDVLAAASADVKRRFRIVEKRSQAKDHPLLVGFPESYYLKCFVLDFLD